MKKKIRNKRARVRSVVASIMLLLVCQLVACRGTLPPASSESSPTGTIYQMVLKTKELSQNTQATSKRGEKLKFATEGIDIAKRCIMAAPEEAACYYWHAVNTGLYYESKIIGYQNGVKTMIANCNKVIELNERYEHGGAYRILGELYTKLPQTSVHPTDITRDLKKAEKYLREAIRISSNYPENHILLSENLLAQGRVEESLKSLARARELIPEWKKDSSYESWLVTEEKLQSALASRTKK